MGIEFYIIAFLVLALLIGFAYENLSAWLDREQYKKPDGDLVDIGGYKLHYILKGERKTGQPLVVLESSLGQNHLDWQKVQPEIAEFAQVIAYDRAGYAWSERGKSVRNPEQLAEDLHKLLYTANLKPPYLLVGYRFGGMFVRLFADKYPDDVAGIVLVESSHPDVVNEEDNEGEIKRLERNKRIFQPLGLVRWFTNRSYRAINLDAEAKKKYLAFLMLDNSNLVEEAKPLFREGIELSDNISQALTVVSRAEDLDLERERKWSEYQRDLARLAPHAKHIHAETGSRYLLFVEPQIVVKAIRDILED